MLFNNAHCLKLNSNLGVSQEPLTVQFVLTLGVEHLVRLSFGLASLCYLLASFHETVQINQTCFC